MPIIDFSQEQWIPHPTIAGIESKLFKNAAAYAPSDVLLARVNIGGVIPWHVHPDESEVAYVLQGEGVLLTAESEQHESAQEQKVTSGSAMLIPPNLWHSLVNTGELEMILFALHTP